MEHTHSDILEDSGKRQEYSSGAVRDPSAGKGRPDLVSPFAYMRLAKHYENGANKYADRNWEKGIDFQRCTASMERHLQAWKMGKTEEDHLAAIAWNAFAIMHYQELHMNELNNMPQYNLEKGE